jgi:hypothetical protein
MTSLLREEMPVPIASAASRMITSRRWIAPVAQGALAKPKVWDDPLLRILLERGASHEQNYVEHLTGAGLDVIRINDVEVTNGAAAETLAAMTANAAFIYSDEVTV